MKNRETFRSKIGVTYAVSSVLLLTFIVGTFRDTWSWGAPGETVFFSLLNASFAVLIVWCSFTKYVIDTHRFVVRCGPFRWAIPLANIVGVESTDSLVAAPALAMSRLEVIHLKGSVVISPCRRREFLSSLERAVLTAGGVKLDTTGVK